MITGPNNTSSTSSSAINKYSAESKAGKASAVQASAPAPLVENSASATPPPAGNVSLSKEAKMMQKLSQEISSYPSVDETRVAEIKKEVDSGGYKINSAAIAQKIMLLDSLF